MTKYIREFICDSCSNIDILRTTCEGTTDEVLKMESFLNNIENCCENPNYDLYKQTIEN